MSVALGTAIWFLFGSLAEGPRVLFEGIAALIAVAVLTSMIFWMALKGRKLKHEVEARVETAMTQGAVVGLASITFVLVFREGLETVLFLTPFLVSDAVATIVGAVLGVAAGTALAYAVFRLGLKLNLRKFFYFTSILLVLIAGGLLGLGVHELIEYGEETGSFDLGVWATYAYVLPIDKDDAFGHKGVIGSIFAVMFGYNVSPEWARVIAHVTYLAITLPFITLVYRRPDLLSIWSSRIRGVPSPAAQRRSVPREE